MVNPETIMLHRLNTRSYEQGKLEWKSTDKQLKNTLRKPRKTHAKYNINNLALGGKSWRRNIKQITANPSKRYVKMHG